MAQAALPGWSEIPKPYQTAILVGVPCLIAATLIYFIWVDLGTLGADEEHLPTQILRPSEESIYGQIHAINSQIDDLDRRIRQGPALAQELQAIQDDMELIRERLPQTAEIEDTRALLSTTAGEINEHESMQCLFVGVSISTGDSGGGRGRGRQRASQTQTQEITYNIEILCNYEGLIGFVNAIENNYSPFMKIDQISVNPGGISTNEEAQDRRDVIGYNMHGVQLTIVTYVYTGGQED